jgi:hypothetical protein
MIGRSKLLQLGLAAMVVLPGVAQAQIFSGADVATGIVAPGAGTPNSVNARNAHIASLGGATVNLLTFESVALGQTINLAPGVTATYTNQDANFGGVRTGNTVNLGYNTTVAGNRFMGLSPNGLGNTGSLTFNFATAINFFGGYFTGVERPSCGVITATWGAASFGLVNTGSATDCSATAGIQWFGFRSNNSFTSVTFTEVSAANLRDIIGIDDVIYGTVVIPEPSTYALLATGLAAMAVVGRRRRRV